MVSAMRGLGKRLCIVIRLRQHIKIPIKNRKKSTKRQCRLMFSLLVGYICVVGQVAQAAKKLGYGLDGPSSISGVGGVEIFFSLLRVQTGRGVHSSFYKMSTGSSPVGQWRSSVGIATGYADPCIHIPLGSSWPVMGYLYLLYICVTVCLHSELHCSLIMF